MAIITMNASAMTGQQVAQRSSTFWLTLHCNRQMHFFDKGDSCHLACVKFNRLAWWPMQFR